MHSTLFDKTQFPWISSSILFPKGKNYPKLSIVVPSYNQAHYLEETLLSILRQNYPHLELIVIDGGSTDGSVEIIRQYENQISYWVSEKDRGQSHAINKGFEKSTGEWIAWINSDDCYLEGAFHFVFEELRFDRYDFLFGNCSPGASMATRHYRHVTRNYRGSVFQLLLFFHSTQYMIPSQSVFVRRSVAEKAGWLDENCHYVMDMEWYVRIYQQTRRRLFYKKSICFYRLNENTKTGSAANKMMQEAKSIATKYLPSLNFWERFLLRRLVKESVGFEKDFDMFGSNSWPKLGIMLWKYPLSCFTNLHFIAYIKNKIMHDFS